MRNAYLILAAMGLGWGSYEWYFKPPPPAPPEPVKPTASVENMLSAVAVTAEDLANLEARYPAQTEAALRNRLLVISGEIAALRVTGMQKDTAELVLRTSTRRKVRLEIDLNKYEAIRNVRKTALRYEVLNSELIETDPQSRQITVIFRVGQKVKQRSRFVNVGASELIFQAE